MAVDDPLFALRSRYLARLQSDRAAILAVFVETPVDVARLQNIAHSIAGSAAVFGYSDLSKVAADLDIAIDETAGAPDTHIDSVLNEIGRILDQTG